METNPLSPKKVIEIFSRFQESQPEPKTELDYHSNFELLIGVILSAQATDVSVNKATKKLFAVANTPEKIFALGEEKLKDFIKTIGLYNMKAKHIIKTCQILIENFSSIVPSDRQSLESLPGVGRKTASVVLNAAFNQPTIAVDTHVFRVSNRIGLVATKTPNATEKKLLQIIPEKFLFYANHWLVLHGRYTCLARKPRCQTCIINDLCQYPNKL